MKTESNSTVRQKYSLILFVLLGLFCLRVIGQALVAFFHVPYLPSMQEWFSGILSYPLLLTCQILIIILFSKICFDLANGKGYFAIPKPRLGKTLLIFGLLYLLVMIIRYVLRMTLYPQERWTGGSIPIFFHLVLASYLITLGYYHWKYSNKNSGDFKTSRPSLSQLIERGSFTLDTSLAIGLWVLYQVFPSYLAHRLSFPPAQYAVRVEKKVPLITKDGTKLVSNIYHPQHLNHTATVLVRIPLSNSIKFSLYSDIICKMWAEHGYTVVMQGSRGRFGSEGVFYPLKTDRQDGIDTLKWLSKQSWFNGQIIMWGGSASGYTQWAIADQDNPGPSALTIYLASSNFHRMFYPGDAFSLSSALSWALTSEGKKDRSTWPSMKEVLKAASSFPMMDADKRAIGKTIPFFRDWVMHPKCDSYWVNIDGVDRNKSIKSPVLLLSGWYDPFLPTQLQDFIQIKKYGRPDIASKSRLIIGPWTHAGQIKFPNGQESENFRTKSIAVSLPWFENILGNKSSAEQETFPVEIFVMGANKWRHEKEWPLSKTQYTPFYLSSNKNANSSAGDGLLSLNPDNGGRLSDEFNYDPSNPVPSMGGAVIGNGGGIARQNDVEARQDVLVYTTPELKEDLEITGPVSLILYVSTSVSNTDFTGKLVDVYPDGRSYNISDGIIRRPYKLTPNSMNPVEKIEVEMWPTSIVLFRGHRIRLEISSSNFPRYDRNPNTGNCVAAECAPVVAHQTIYHSANYPSRLILPL